MANNKIRKEQVDFITTLSQELVQPEITAAQSQGSTFLVAPLGSKIPTGTTPLNDGTAKWIAVWVYKPITITGFFFYQQTQGNFTGDNFNGLNLNTMAAGSLTEVGKTANDANIWKGTSGTWQKVPLTTPYVAVAGLYYIGLLYNNSAQTTAPSLGSFSYGAGGMSTFDMTNSTMFCGTLAAQTALPTPQVMSALSTNSIGIYVGFY